MCVNMRQQFTSSMQYLSDRDERVITLLNDVGVYAFRHLKEKYPDRVYNLGIMEQASISIAAGLSMTGYVPVFHTIAPFIAERGYEQLKDDFGYQNINGNFVSVGASYDYSGLGTTHYCPGDVGALLQIPNMQIVIPGTAEEFHTLLCEAYDNGSPTYYRLSEESNRTSQKIEFGKATVIKQGARATVIAVGTMLDRVLAATKGLDVSVLYYTTIAPFDAVTLQEMAASKKILLCEPYYYGALTSKIVDALAGSPIQITYAGVLHEDITCYGTRAEIDESLQLTAGGIRGKLLALIGAAHI